MLRATRLIQDKAEGILPLVALSPMLSVDEVQGILASSPSEVRIYQGKTREVLLASRAAVVASGTATLEAALLGTPMVVIYRTSWLSYLLGRLLIRVPHISLVNLLAGEELVPELVQGALTPEAIRRHLLVLLCNTDKRNRMIRGFEEIRKSLGEEVAGRRAAQIVREMIRSGAAGGAGA
jgi:lipid-A-disaccharide synthase